MAKIFSDLPSFTFDLSCLIKDEHGAVRAHDEKFQAALALHLSRIESEAKRKLAQYIQTINRLNSFQSTIETMEPSIEYELTPGTFSKFNSLRMSRGCATAMEPLSFSKRTNDLCVFDKSGSLKNCWADAAHGFSQTFEFVILPSDIQKKMHNGKYRFITNPYTGESEFAV